jgi:oxygen-independent coproporphyrinogen-3 oxidase
MSETELTRPLARPVSRSTALGSQSVPRYTSYPTAPNFSPAVGADAHAKWLSEVPASDTVSLYLHVPYCVELCHYCGCNTTATRRREPVEVYATHLVNEIALVSKRLGSKKVCRIHWGGGTPSILGGKNLERIFRSISSYFDLKKLDEHAIELDPRRLDGETLASLAAIGVNRANLGVQDFSPKVQKAIGRIQPFELVELAASRLRSAGITGIGMDLMYGLPLQTLEDVQFSATLSARLKPQRVAMFGYAHVPWFKRQQSLIDARTLPNAGERLAQATAAQQAWTDLGYRAIGIDHFALPADGLAVAAAEGRLKRNFQGYTDDDSPVVLGLGASAISRFRNSYTQNHAATAYYKAAITSGNFATIRGIALSPEDSLRAEIIERLMCEFAVDIDRIVQRRQTPAIFSTELARIDRLSDRGLVRRSGRKIRVTESGKPFIRIVASVFDKYLADGTSRHSQAV